MAKRRRLTPVATGLISGRAPALETKSMDGGVPPIASVAGDSAARAALEEVSHELSSARAQGRLVQVLPLSDVDADHLMRDRMVSDDEDMQTLMQSLRARGQQSPIEVMALDGGGYGLISGWRRLAALRALSRETGDDRFATVQALVRVPDTAADAYQAMVEENEIRVGLSYYERARVAARAAEAGVFPTAQLALRHLFAAASRSKRSKIGSFLVIYAKLDPVLKFPAALSERQGLALAKRLEGEDEFAPQLQDMLEAAAPQDAAAEQAVIAEALAGKTSPASGHKTESNPPQKPTLDRPEGAEEIAHGVYLQTGGGALRPTYTLSGPKVDGAFRVKLEDWLRNGG